MSDSGQNRDKAPYQEFSERLTDAMLEAGYAAREGSWSRLPVEIEPLRREAQAKSLTTARKYLEGEALPRRHRLERIAEWLNVYCRGRSVPSASVNQISSDDWGGEFGILLLTDSIEQAQSVTERLRATLEKSEVDTGSQPLVITASFGLAEVKPGETLDNLYHRADAACYEAKRNGRNQVILAS